MLKEKARMIARVVYVADLALTTAAFFAAFFIRDLVLPRIAPGQFPTGLFPLREYVKLYPVVLILWSVLLFSYHSYHSHRTVPLLREALTAIRVVLVGNAILATLAYLMPLRQLSRAWFILFGVLAALLLVLEKVVVRIIARYVRAKGLNYRTILIVGTGRRAIEVARTIEGHKYWGYKILGFVSDGHRLSNGWARFRVYGSVPDLRRLLEGGQFAEPIDEIVFAVTRKKLDEMKQIFLMFEDAHERRGEVTHLNEMTGPVFKAKSDPRVTVVGRLLRKFSLDELPQLWNVLKGDMSLVGPRPPIPEEVAAYHRWHRRRLSMKPGLTCLWQVSGRNNVDFDRWMQMDLQYIDNWSPSLDLKILLRTIPALLSGRGAS